MPNLAIPSVAASVVPDTNPGSAPTHPAQRFDDTLRESQSAAKPHADAHQDQDAGAPAHKQDSDTAAAHTDDKHSSDDANAAPTTATAAMIAPAVVRQAPAASGKRLPVAGDKSADATTPAVAASTVAPPQLFAAIVVAPAAAASTAANAAPAPKPTAPTSGLALTAALQAPTSALQPGTPALVGQPNASPVANSTAAATIAATTDPAASADTATDTLRLLANAAGSPSGNDAKDASSPPGPNGFMAHLAQLTGAQTAPAPLQPPPAQLTMQASPGQPQFAPETAQHVVWMASQGVQRAEIQLNPRKLGPIQVEITTHHDHVDVNFAVQHPQTVHALQQTLPQLHDMLAQQGLNLGQASVGQQAPGQQHSAFAHTFGGHFATVAEIEESEPAPGWRSMRIADPGRVDDFA